MDAEEPEDFDELIAEELLRAHYCPGLYAEGEALCLDILEELKPDWEPAVRFLMLTLAAQDVEEEALELVDELSDEALFESLSDLAFGAGTETEEILYEDILLCLEERGEAGALQTYFDKRVLPPEKHAEVVTPEPWELKRSKLPNPQSAEPKPAPTQGDKQKSKKVRRNRRRNTR